MTGTVCIAGLGACTAVGADLWSSAAAVRAGVCGFEEHPFMVDQAGEAMIVARASYLNAGSHPRAARIKFLAVRAAKEAAQTILDRSSRAASCDLFLGLPEENSESTSVGQNLPQMLADALAPMRIDNFQTVCCGHSAALLALDLAVERVRSGRAEYCVVGGADSYIEPELLEELDRTGQLHSPSNAWGFVPGEGAAFCLVTTLTNIQRVGIRSLGQVAAVSSAWETKLIRTGSVCIGLGLSKAIRNALRALPGGEKVSDVIADMNGDAYRAEEYGFTIARSGEYFRDGTDVITPSDCCGDVGAASGILFLGLAIAAASKGYATGPHTLIWTSSDTGERAAALVHAPVQSALEHLWA